jgi:hypothetical protein
LNKSKHLIKKLVPFAIIKETLVRVGRVDVSIDEVLEDQFTALKIRGMMVVGLSMN